MSSLRNALMAMKNTESAKVVLDTAVFKKLMKAVDALEELRAQTASSGSFNCNLEGEENDAQEAADAAMNDLYVEYNEDRPERTEGFKKQVFVVETYLDQTNYYYDSRIFPTDKTEATSADARLIESLTGTEVQVLLNREASRSIKLGKLYYTRTKGRVRYWIPKSIDNDSVFAVEANKGGFEITNEVHELYRTAHFLKLVVGQ